MDFYSTTVWSVVVIVLFLVLVGLIALEKFRNKKQIITTSIFEQRKELKTKIENLMISEKCDLEFYREVDKTMIDLIVNTNIKNGRGQNGGMGGNN